MSFFDFIENKTVGMALFLVPALANAFGLKLSDEAIFAKLPDKWKKNATLEEFDSVLATGKAFMAAVYAFLHK